MNLKFLKILEDLDTIIYITDLQTYEILWMNQLGKQKFGNFKENCYCYNLIKNSNEQCNDCPFKIDYDKVSNDSYATYSIRLHDCQYQCKKRIFEINNKKYSIDIWVDINSLNQNLYNNELNTMVFQTLINSMPQFDLKDSVTRQVEKILEVIKNIFGSKRVTLFDPKNSIPVISVQNSDAIDEFKYNSEFNELINNDKDFSKQINTRNYFILDPQLPPIKTDFKFAKLKKNMIENGYSNIIMMRWVIDNQTFNMVLENSHVLNHNQSIFKYIFNYFYYFLRTIKYNQELYNLGNIDGLTNAFNRNKYNNDLKQIYSVRVVNKAVIFFDIDNLKGINDTLGHIAGDKLIVNTANVLVSSFPNYNLYRIGGDEFVLIGDEPSYDSLKDKVKIMKKALLEQQIVASYGISYAKEADLVSYMVIRAEQEMYSYKRKHHLNDLDDGFSYHIEQIQKRPLDEQFSLVALPQYNQKTMQMTGLEIFIRGTKNSIWDRPREFIALFEEHNCIHDIDYYVLQEACKIYQKLKNKCLIYVNISLVSLVKNNFVENILKLFKQYDVCSDCIQLEVTENTIEFNDIIYDKINLLKNNGISVWLDNFDFSLHAFNILKKGQFDRVKLSEQAIKSLLDNPNLRIMVKDFIKNCHDNNIEIGITALEDEKSLDMVKKLNFDLISGFYLHNIMTLEEIKDEITC